MNNFFGEKYSLLPGDEKKRKIIKNKKLIDSWEGSLASDDEALRNQSELTSASWEKHIDYLRVMYIVVALLFAGLIGRLYYLQVIMGAESLRKAEGNVIHVKTNYAPRGVIYDRDKVILAGNVARYDLKVIPAMLPKEDTSREKMYQEIGQVIGMDYRDVRAKAEKEGKFGWNEVVLVKNLEREKALEIKIKTYPGFLIDNISTRQYYCNEECAHFIGYTGEVSEQDLTENEIYQPIDQVGKAGLEVYYEKQLKGINGAEYRLVDATGNITNFLTPKKSQPGNNLITTIDDDIQKLAYQELMEAMNKEGVTGGAIIATDPRNGEVLALVSAPSFSANQFSRGISVDDYDKLNADPKLPLFNKAISGEYPPGSTFKLVTASGILSEKLADIDTVINDQGSLRVVNKYNPDIVYVFWSWNHAGLGPVNVSKAISMSSDIYFYIFGGGYEKYEGLGINRLKTYAEKYGMNNTLGIDLYGERSGFIPTPEWKQKLFNETWYQGDDYNTAIGQGDILATPLQVNAYTLAIANGGKIYRPHLIDEIVDQDGKVIVKFNPEINSDKIVDEEVMKTVREAMRLVVTEGTGKMMLSAVVPVAGKTGTAQYANNDKEHAWFTCFAPYDNPTLALTVLVEGGGEGSETAVPIALELINKYFENK